MKPIIFSTPMVRAILEGRKTMTRRVELTRNPFKPGDVLWVRETWCRIGDPDLGIYDGYMFKADWPEGLEHPTWHPSMYMPRDAARIFLRITNTQEGKLWQVTAADAIREGCVGVPSEQTNDDIHGCIDSRRLRFDVPPMPEFIRMWDALNAKRGYGWDTNPWVRVYTFDRISAEEAKGATP